MLGLCSSFFPFSISSFLLFHWSHRWFYFKLVFVFSSGSQIRTWIPCLVHHKHSERCGEELWGGDLMGVLSSKLRSILFTFLKNYPSHQMKTWKKNRDRHMCNSVTWLTHFSLQLALNNLSLLLREHFLCIIQETRHPGTLSYDSTVFLASDLFSGSEIWIISWTFLFSIFKKGEYKYNFHLFL